jgi:putative peptidoglycan lipid II flippase
VKERLGRNIITVGGLTGISRILGYIRDMVTAWLLGATGLADAFFIAYRIPNLLRRIMGEGAITIAVVPVFNEVKEKEGIEKAFKMAESIFTLMFISLVIISIIGELIAPGLVALLAFGKINTGDFQVAVHLTRIMFPFILLIGIVSLFMGILNSIGHFAAPAGAPILLNIFMIGTPVIFYVWYPFFSSPADALAWGVIAGGVAQILLQLPLLKRYKVPIRFNADFRDRNVRQVTRLMGIAAIGASIYQINVLIGTQLASFLKTGSISFLYYAQRLLELPLGIFAFAVGNVMLPAMSSASARMDNVELSSLISRALVMVLVFTVPSSIALIILAEPVTAVLFIRGAFTITDAKETAYALQMYSISLWAIGYVRILNQALYSMQEAKTVVNIGWIALVVNIILSLLLMIFMRHAGIALASSLSVLFQLIVFHFVLVKKQIRFNRSLYKDCLKILAASSLMGIVLYLFILNNFWLNGLNMNSLITLSACIIAGTATYFGVLYFSGIRLTKIFSRRKAY